MYTMCPQCTLRPLPIRPSLPILDGVTTGGMVGRVYAMCFLGSGHTV
jgi:hypothetical protein